MQNYHKHTSYSNILIGMDSIASYEEYAKRAVELGHKILSSVEHGWQSNYYVPYGIAQKYGLKFIFGTEAYWVKDRTEKDNTNNHIIILAKNENGRQAINDVLAEASITGYYYRPRLDIDLILSLPPEDIFITTACIGFYEYGLEESEKFILSLHNHFKENLMLEIQYHNTEPQIKLNKQIKKWAKKYNIEMIVGLDSHYIFPEDAILRDEALKSKGIVYANETGWFMDYPSDDECIERFLQQGIFNKAEIQQAMNNTDICLTFDNFEFSKDIKLPTLFPDKTQEEKNKIYSRLITKKFKEYMKDIPPEEYEKYYQGVKEEVQVYKDTGMVDYPLINYKVIQRGIENGGVITDSGRGSAVGFFTNTLCGFSKVDRFKSAIHLYPERFMSTSRILDTKSLPDIDFNVANTEPFERAQKEILGEEHSYPMIAFGTLKKKSAFKLYARAKDIPAQTANEITKQIEKYETDLKHADDDERQDINIYDYVDEKYHDHLKQSESYWGIISDRKKAPSAHLLYQGNIRKEIGLIKCKSESTKKECITTVIDGAVAEEYKFLKNDLLTVNVVDIIDRVFKRVGIEHFNVNTLLKLIKEDQATWGIYAKGLTIGVNQCEKNSTTKKAMKYKPRNPSELAAFIAAIRPGFKSMYSVFESRQPFSYGVATLDNLLITEELPVPFMIFQEQTMKVLNYAGFPMDECYGLIKAISKKKPEKVKAIKDKFIVQFADKIKEDNDLSDAQGLGNSEKVWKVVDDNSGYAFNSSHAYCMALDSLYCAYLKSHYPYEFYEVLLQFYSDKGNKDKVAELKREMLQGFGIREGKFKFGNDNRRFKADQANGVIYSSLLSLKNMNQKCSEDLYKLSQKKQYTDFFELLQDIKKLKSLKSDQLNILVNIGYFDDFGTVPQINEWITSYDDLYGRSQFSKETVEEKYLSVITPHTSETEKQYREFDYLSAIKDYWALVPATKLGLKQRIKNEIEYFGYIQTIVPKLPKEYIVVTAKNDKYSKLTITGYVLKTGETQTYKIQPKIVEQCGDFNEGDILKLMDTKEEGKWKKNEQGDWIRSTTETEMLIKKYALTN